MKLISVDLEMNQPSKNIIQIGAVCFQPDNGLVSDTMDLIINPQEPIDPYITTLTRITNSQAMNGVSIQQGAQHVTAFKVLNQINPIGIVWGAGKSNDIRKIYEQSGVESPFDMRIIDVKAVYQMLANASNAQMRQKVGLKTACDNLGIGWDTKYGEPHDALADAYNTARVYMFLSKCLKGGFDIKTGKHHLSNKS